MKEIEREEEERENLLRVAGAVAAASAWSLLSVCCGEHRCSCRRCRRTLPPCTLTFFFDSLLSFVLLERFSLRSFLVGGFWTLFLPFSPFSHQLFAQLPAVTCVLLFIVCVLVLVLSFLFFSILSLLVSLTSRGLDLQQH